MAHGCVSSPLARRSACGAQNRPLACRLSTCVPFRAGSRVATTDPEMVMRVLLAEDDAALADVIARGLRREALSVDIAPDGGTALERARTVAYDVIVLDRDLPVLHGDAVCEAL